MDQILELNHINIETNDIDRSARFYNEVLGLVSGERPEFDRPGHWMYLGDMPIVHIIEPLPDNKMLTGSKDAAISHFALSIKSYEIMRDHLDKFQAPTAVNYFSMIQTACLSSSFIYRNRTI
jgi:catechol 2,3-dioxygenase-like lactoylglutathione lyase family enzyme